MTEKLKRKAEGILLQKRKKNSPSRARMILMKIMLNKHHLLKRFFQVIRIDSITTDM